MIHSKDCKTEKLDHNTEKKSRLEVRLNKESKRYYEQVAISGHYKNLSAFVLAALQDKAQEIEKSNRIVLATQRDRELFSNMIINPPRANKALREAFERNRQYFKET